MENNRYPFVNLPLKYPYDGLEPFIDAKTMELHHDRHLQTYINNLNDILKEHPRLQKLSLQQLIIISPRLPRELGQKITNNAGGVYNHRFFFDGMTDGPNTFPVGTLADKIALQYGSFDNFKALFKEAALSVFGSGYAWLTYKNNQLRIITTANQDTPLPGGFCPIITLDVWEHAYYLKHYNLRGDYIDDWMNIVDWNKAEENFINCRK